MRWPMGIPCEMLASDGAFTIGIVQSRPAFWAGNRTLLQPGDTYYVAPEDLTFEVGYDLYFITKEGQWGYNHDENPLFMLPPETVRGQNKARLQAVMHPWEPQALPSGDINPWEMT